MSTPADPFAGDLVDVRDVADANDLRETGPSAGPDTGARTELPLEADPADVAEQDAAVPFDDEDR